MRRATGNGHPSLPSTFSVMYRRHVGFVFQRFNLLPALTALDNVIAPVIPQRVAYDKVGRGRELPVSLAAAIDCSRRKGIT